MVPEKREHLSKLLCSEAGLSNWWPLVRIQPLSSQSGNCYSPLWLLLMLEFPSTPIACPPSLRAGLREPTIGWLQGDSRPHVTWCRGISTEHCTVEVAFTWCSVVCRAQGSWKYSEGEVACATRKLDTSILRHCQLNNNLLYDCLLSHCFFAVTCIARISHQ